MTELQKTKALISWLGLGDSFGEIRRREGCHTLTFALEVLALQKEVLHRCVKTHPISKDIVKRRRLIGFTSMLPGSVY